MNNTALFCYLYDTIPNRAFTVGVCSFPYNMITCVMRAESSRVHRAIVYDLPVRDWVGHSRQPMSYSVSHANAIYVFRESR